MCATGLPGVVAVQHPLRQLLLPGLHGPHLLDQGEVLVRGRSGDYPSALDRHMTGEIRDRPMIFNSTRFLIAYCVLCKTCLPLDFGSVLIKL